MGEFYLDRGHLGGSTAISNVFIEEYMPQANGDFVKIYLYLLRLISSQDSDMSIGKLADYFNYTEGDVVRALKYWESAGLMTLCYNAQGEINSIRMESCMPKNRCVQFAGDTQGISSISGVTNSGLSAVETVKLPDKKKYSAKEIAGFSENEDISQLFFIASSYLGKTLSPSDTNTILYLFDSLGFSSDLIEYLIEYCVNAGHSNMRYIEKTALAWAQDGITSVEEAKEEISACHTKYYSVFNALGITGRKPGKSEKEFIGKWTDSFGFGTDIIVEACNRTIDSIHQPSFKYVDSILSNWHNLGVNSLSQIAALDEEHKNSQIRRKQRVVKPGSGSAKVTGSHNNIHKFPQRDYNYGELEKKLLSNRQ
jgi:DnaD/phage-associated family protein